MTFIKKKALVSEECRMENVELLRFRDLNIESPPFILYNSPFTISSRIP